MALAFAFYEIVRVRRFPRSISDDTAFLEGVVLGVSEPEQGEPSYSVHLTSLGRSWMFAESELEGTGRSVSEEEFYDGTSVRVNRKGRLLD